MNAKKKKKISLKTMGAALRSYLKSESLHLTDISLVFGQQVQTEAAWEANIITGVTAELESRLWSDRPGPP